MKLNEITTPSKMKMDVAFIDEIGIVWMENAENQFTLDIPHKFNMDDRTFEITKESESYWCFDDQHGYHFVSRTDKKYLVLFMEKTDVGFEIQSGDILHEVTKH